MGTRHDWEQLTRLLATGVFKPTVDEVFPLEQAAAAQQRMEQREQFGKLVLSIPPLA
jgi:NADPH:quinone reductase-like Zn-dependent oxidoreductase